MDDTEVAAEARLAAILLELEGIVHHYHDRYLPGDPAAQSGADVVCGRLDVLLARESRRPCD